MSKIDENEIRRRLELLSQIQPNPEATERAINRARLGFTWGTVTRSYKIKSPSPIIKFAAAAVLLICAGFLAGRWSKLPRPAPYSLDVTGYTSVVPAYPTTRKSEDSFWRQKTLAAMQPRPYAQTSTTKTNLLNAYKQYLKEKHYD